MMKSISILIGAALIALGGAPAGAQPKSAEPAAFLVTGSGDEVLELALLLQDPGSRKPCSLSFTIEAFDATAVDRPLQTERVMLGPDGFLALEFPFSFAPAGGPGALLLTFAELRGEAGCRLLSSARLKGPDGVTTGTVDMDIDDFDSRRSLNIGPLP